MQRVPSTITLNVSVSDGVFTSTAQVHIRVERANLHAPQFTQGMYEADLQENAPVGSKVIAIRAQDADPGPFGDVRYVLLSDSARDLFSIDGNGQIKTLERLDREERSEMVLSIAAVDAGGRSGYCSVRVTILDENDNAPQFGASEYHASMRSEVEPGTLVTQVQAWDLDQGANGQVSYSLYSEASMQVTELLDIDPDSGWVRLLDREVQSSYHITVRASDQGVPVRLSSLVNITITVLDINDNPPVFERRDYLATLPEDVAVGTEVVQVYAASKDIGTNADIYYNIRSGNQQGHFTININTGDMHLDYYLRPTFLSTPTMAQNLFIHAYSGQK
uniref:Cadherin domain-containing protein n=1 Tax=Sinocyclocheilus rhinocerous TaxID=307959 RepID=A0A673LS02_9TELE